LLLTAGVFAAQGKLSLAVVIVVVAAAAIAGDNTGYHIGRRYGRRLFRKPDGIVFRHEYVERAEKFFDRFGNKAMLLAHFVPVVRTFAPAVAGVASMPRKQFIIYDAIGDTAWAIILTMIGYWFGTKIPNIDHYILLAVAAATLITLGPSVYHLYQAVRNNRAKKNPKAS
jgi:membrane-associated protein